MRSKLKDFSQVIHASGLRALVDGLGAAGDDLLTRASGDGMPFLLYEAEIAVKSGGWILGVVAQC